MAMTPLVFSKPQLMLWNNNKITDHNRSELAIGVDRIEEKQRMANGTLRKYIIADKRTFTVSWSDVPHSAAYTVDGFWGKREIEAFYNTVAGPFTLKVSYGDNTSDTYNVMFSDYNADLKKRGLYDFWNVSVQFEEV